MYYVFIVSVSWKICSIISVSIF